MESYLNRRLICFGDSWTAGHGVELDSKWQGIASTPRFITNLREQNSWPRWVSNKLNIPYVNMGVCGYGNEYIFNDLEDSIISGFIDKNDIILVVFSYPYRYKKHNEHTPSEIFNKFENILQGYSRFYFNGFYPLFRDEDFDIESLPSTFINPTSTLSNVLREYEIKNNVSVWEYDSRCVWNDEQGFWEGNYHPNLLGYKILSDYIYSNIKNN